MRLLGPVSVRLRRGMAVLHRDPLTGLPMRPHLMRLLRRDLGSGDTGALIGLLYLDLDSFKRVNDSAGHDVGDEVLALAAERITVAAGPDAAVARLSGDEFAVLLRSCASVEEVRATAQRVSRALAAPLPEHLASAGLNVAGMASVGTTVRLADDHAGRRPGADEAMLHEADLAMLAAKRRGGGHVEHYRPDLASGRPSSAPPPDALAQALDERDFQLGFQPVVDVASGRAARVEALLRLRTDDGTGGLPGDLLGVAAATGRLHQVTDWVLARALAECERWWGEGHHVPVAVNLSADELAQTSGAGGVLSMLRNTDLPTTALVVEVHRGVGAALDMDGLAGAVRSLQDAGVGVVLEDVDTHWPLHDALAIRPDAVTIGRATVARLVADGAAASLAVALGTAAAGVGARVTAKGVETEPEAQAAGALGCAEMQGDHLVRVTSADLLEWRTSHLTMRDAPGQRLTGESAVATVCSCTPASSYAERATAETQQSRDPSSPSGPRGFSRPSGHFDAAEES